MAYDSSIPVAANVVRGAGGDLVKMQENFAALEPLVNAYTLSGPDLQGLNFTDSSGFRLLAVGDSWQLARFSGGWVTMMEFGNGAVPIQVFTTISGQTPTAAAHLATKGYVDARVIDDLADVTITGAVNNEGLVYSGGVWRNRPVASTLAGLGDVALAGPATGQGLIYNGVQWTNSGIATALAGLTDVDVTGVVNGNTLIYSGGVWRDGVLVSDHGGLTGLADDDHVQYSLADGTRPFTGVVSGITPTQPAHLATKQYVDTLSGLSVTGATTLSGLTDVSDDVDLQPDGYLLTLSGNNWYARPSAAAAAAVNILQVQVFS